MIVHGNSKKMKIEFSIQKRFFVLILSAFLAYDLFCMFIIFFGTTFKSIQVSTLGTCVILFAILVAVDRGLIVILQKKKNLNHSLILFSVFLVSVLTAFTLGGIRLT